MGRKKHRHRKHNNHQQQQQHHQRKAEQCKGNCQPDPEVEIVPIDTQEELQELFDVIIAAGEAKQQRYKDKQDELNNALLEDVGIPIRIEEPAAQVLTCDDSAI